MTRRVDELFAITLKRIRYKAHGKASSFVDEEIIL